MATTAETRGLRLSSWPWASAGIAIGQLFVFLAERRAIAWGIIEPLIRDYSFSWPAFQANPIEEWPKLITHLFLHADAGHLAGNLFFFALFAPAVERRLGTLAFAVSYFCWGAAASLTQAYFEPFSTGLIGASGAISGAAGAFFVFYPLRLPVGFLRGVGFRFLAHVPAFFLIGLWFLSQIRAGVHAVAEPALAGRVTMVAYWAHVGGFAAGALTALLAVTWRARSNRIVIS